jgi:spermidine/putrescine transport system permease protein
MTRMKASDEQLLVSYGEITSRPRLLRRGLMLAGWGLAWLAIFLVIPCFLLVALGFARRGDYGEVVWSFTIENYKRLLGYGLMGWSADYLFILLRSLWVALVTTALSLALGYPLAFFIAARRGRWRYVWLALIVIPLCTNLVIRAYAWRLILEAGSPPARFAQFLGLLPENSGLYPGSFALYIGMLSAFLPFAVLPLYTSVERIDWSIVEAAQDLFARPARVFLHGILPQTLPGLWAAVILTFIPAAGVFVVPNLLGGAKTMLIGNLIEQQFNASRDWPFGAAVSFSLILMMIAGLFALRRRGVAETL